MVFVKTKAYWENRIKNIIIAIKGTEKDMAELTNEKSIEAHKAQIESYRKSLAKDIEEYNKWKQQRS